MWCSMNQCLLQELKMKYCNTTQQQQQQQLSTRATRLLPAQRASPSQVLAGVPPSPLGIHTGLSQGCRPHHRILAPQTQPSWEGKQKDEAHKNPFVSARTIMFSSFLIWSQLIQSCWFSHICLQRKKPQEFADISGSQLFLPIVQVDNSHIMEYQQCASLHVLCKCDISWVAVQGSIVIAGVGVWCYLNMLEHQQDPVRNC